MESNGLRLLSQHIPQLDQRMNGAGLPENVEHRVRLSDAHAVVALERMKMGLHKLVAGPPQVRLQGQVAVGGR